MRSDLARKLAEALWRQQQEIGCGLAAPAIADLLDRAGLADAVELSEMRFQSSQRGQRYRAALEQISGFPIRSDKPYTLMDAVEAAREALRDE